MASFLVKRVASNLLRVRSVASSSHFYSTKGYEFVQHDTKDECILKCDDSLGSSVARGVVNDAFTPHTSPTENLARLLNLSDLRLGYLYGTHAFPRWSVVEDEKALYILRDMTAKDIEDVRESVKEFMSGIHDNVVKESVPERNLFPIIDIMRGTESAPGEYYYHVMKDAKEVSQFVKSLHGTGKINALRDSFIKAYAVPHNPQAVYIILVLGDLETRNPYGGYAIEIFLEDSLYAVCDIKTDFTGLNRKIYIPKKKTEGTKKIGGNLIFFCEKKFIN